VDLIKKIINHLDDPFMLTVVIVMAVVGIGGLAAIIFILKKDSDPKEPKPKKVKPPKVKKPKKEKPPKVKKPKKEKPPKVKKPKKEKKPKVKKPKKNKAAKIEAAEEIPQQTDIDEDLFDFEPNLEGLGLDIDDEIDLAPDTAEAAPEPEIDNEIDPADDAAEATDAVNEPETDDQIDFNIDAAEATDEQDIFAGIEEDELSEITADIEDADEVIPVVEDAPEELAVVEEASEVTPVVEDKKRKPKKVKEPKAKKVKPPKAKKVKEPKPKKTKKDKSKKSKLPSHVAEAEVIAETDHKVLIERIERIGKKLRSVLFGGAGIESLPLTIPVNIAIELSKKGNKCLLIDLDLKRDAISTAFDIEEDKKPTDFTPKPFDTSLENLKVWPAFNFSRRRYVSVRSLVDAAVDKYDYVLINAPYLDGNVDRSQIGLAAACAFIFTQTPKQTTRMYKLLESCNCKIMGNFQVDNQSAST
jgi:Mrp family chromosome partitioning ATPase